MRKIVTAVALVLCLILTACNAGAAPGGEPATSLNVDMSEFMFTPSSYSIPAGKKITLQLKNSGDIEHDFIILKKGIEVKGSFDHEKRMGDIYFHAMLEAHKSGEFTFTAPADAGDYQIICGVLGHFQAGMIGKLTVVSP